MNNEQERQNEPPKFILPPICNLPAISLINTPNNNPSARSAGILPSPSKISQVSFSQAQLNNRSTLIINNSVRPNRHSMPSQKLHPSHNDLLSPESLPLNDRTNVSFTAYWPGYYTEHSMASHSKDSSNINTSQAVDSLWFGNGEFFYSNRQDTSPGGIPNIQLPSLDALVSNSPHESSENRQFGSDSIRKLSQQQCASDSKDMIISMRRKNANQDVENMDPFLLRKFGCGTQDGNDQEYLNLQIESDNDKKKCRSNWSKKETRSLIAAVKPRWRNLLLAQRNSEKSQVWSEMFSDHSKRFSGRTLKAFKLRWARLVSDFNSVEDSLLAGSEPIDFDYYHEIREILEDDSSNDVPLFQTSKTNEASPYAKETAFNDIDRKRDSEGSIETFHDETLKRTSRKRDRKQTSHTPPLCHPLEADKNGKLSFSQTVKKAKLVAGEKTVETILQQIQDNKRDYERLIGCLKDLTR
ncbi:3232_t:CDS:2 [Acaulospora colombiana]|uniref:3232_t:CDS:1 n=1 Tax=Acaulospora colombiana TaxID=27376 RepID=A0ACA9K7G9_9GLOM|nr:3232_t:CDS:2 [Acaulospora colombiana]